MDVVVSRVARTVANPTETKISFLQNISINMWRVIRHLQVLGSRGQYSLYVVLLKRYM